MYLYNSTTLNSNATQHHSDTRTLPSRTPESQRTGHQNTQLRTTPTFVAAHQRLANEEGTSVITTTEFQGRVIAHWKGLRELIRVISRYKWLAIAWTCRSSQSAWQSLGRVDRLTLVISWTRSSPQACHLIDKSPRTCDMQIVSNLPFPGHVDRRRHAISWTCRSPQTCRILGHVDHINTTWRLLNMYNA